jgi:hypothetical protein
MHDHFTPYSRGDRKRFTYTSQFWLRVSTSQRESSFRKNIQILFFIDFTFLSVSYKTPLVENAALFQVPFERLIVVALLALGKAQTSVTHRNR